MQSTLPETNIALAPKNGGFQYEFPSPGGLFSGTILSFREGK